jgi:hypothetical protein
MDSKVVSGKIKKECIAREPTVEKYLALVRRMENYLKGFTIEYIEQKKNTEADDLVKATACNTSMPPDVFFQVFEDALVKTVLLAPRLINIIEVEDCRGPITTYLRHYYESDSTIEKIRMQQRAKAYILLEVHAGVCGGHIGTHTLAGKVLRWGFYWLAMVNDAAKLV